MRTVVTTDKVRTVIRAGDGDLLPNPLSTFLRKFPLPDRPNDTIPTLPENLDELTDSNLMNLYTEFMAWVSYTKSELVQTEIEEDRKAHILKVTEARAIIDQTVEKVKGDTVTLAKARRDIDEFVLEAQDAYLSARALRKLTEAVFDRCERGAQVLSRELSRRIGLAPKEYKQARYSA
jgi:hypothetical protein